MIWSRHPTRNKATSRCSGLSPVRLAPLPHNPDIPIAVRRECPLAYRGNRPGIHPHHRRLVLPTAGEKEGNQAFRNTCHIFDSVALTLHPSSACSPGSGRQQARKRSGPGRPQMGGFTGLRKQRPRVTIRTVGLCVEEQLLAPLDSRGNQPLSRRSSDDLVVVGKDFPEVVVAYRLANGGEQSISSTFGILSVMFNVDCPFARHHLKAF